MQHAAANAVVEGLRRETQLWLPPLTKRRGFSSSRVEHMLNRLVQAMPVGECYLEVGTLEGRTLEAAAHANDGKQLIGVDPCEKYGTVPAAFGPNVTFIQGAWQEVLAAGLVMPIGLAFYDGDHSASETMAFMGLVKKHLADEAVLVLDDWDRESVRKAALETAYSCDDRWRLLRECPEYTDGLTAPQQQFGYAHGIAVFGFKR